MKPRKREPLEFIEFKVQPQSLESKKSGEINVVLVKDIPEEQLPYREVFTEKVLAEMNATRANECRVVARGDSRDINEITAAGGLHPQFTNPSQTPKAGDSILNIASHLVDQQGSGIVSCTSDMKIAEQFSPGSNGDGYIYLVKATGAIQINTHEKEYCVPGGLDADSIVGYRKVNILLPIASAPIYINVDFMQRYPQHVNSVIDALLKSNESCVYQVPHRLVLVSASNDAFFSETKRTDNQPVTSKEDIAQNLKKK